jgi:hypothetical protein
LRSALAVPIVSNERTAAVLSFYAEASNAFDDAHRRIVEAASRAIAGSMPNLAPDFAAHGTDGRSHNGTRVFRNSKLA